MNHSLLPQQQVTKTKELVTVAATDFTFATTQEHLTAALRSISGVAGRNPTLPILSHVLLQRDGSHLQLTTTDLEVGVKVWLAGKLEGQGGLTIPLRPLLEYVQNLPSDTITLRLARGALNINTPRTHAMFQGDTTENFPIIPTVDKGLNIALPTHAVARALGSVLYAVAADETRPELAGVLVHGQDSHLIFAATDSYRLAEVRVRLPIPLSTEISVIIPARAAQEIHRALEAVTEATLWIDERQLLLRAPTVQVISRRIEGTYPNYEQIIPPQTATRVEVERLILFRAIRASAVFSGNTASRVTLDVTADTLRVSATTPEVGRTEAELPAVVEGEPVQVAFNERFLRDALSALPGDRVTLGLGSATTPAVFRPLPPASGTNTDISPEALASLALVMPIKT